MDILKRKGFYIKPDKIGKGLILNIFLPDFIQFLNDNKGADQWVNLRIYERNQVDPKGFTHNIEAIKQKETANN